MMALMLVSVAGLQGGVAIAAQTKSAKSLYKAAQLAEATNESKPSFT